MTRLRGRRPPDVRQLHRPPRSGNPDFMCSLAKGLQEISRSTGFTRASVRRCLYTLSKLGYIVNGGRRYGLRSNVLGLVFGCLTMGSLRGAARLVPEDFDGRRDQGSPEAFPKVPWT